MMPSTTETSTKQQPQEKPQRQKPGTACEECRRRKLRCDRGKPKCGLCEEAGTECQQTTAKPRGPKQGHVKTLQARISALEGCLLKQQNEARRESAGKEQMIDVNGGLQLDLSSTAPIALEDPLVDSQFPFDAADLPMFSPANYGNMSVQYPFPGALASCSTTGTSTSGNAYEDLSSPSSFGDLLFSNKPSTTPGDIMNLFSTGSGASHTDPMHADRDQLYFDRIHICIPIVHQYRYLSWSREPNKTDGQKCLQYAIWALAASVSTQHQNERDIYYQAARQALEALEAGDQNMDQSIDIAQVQTLLLLALYEFMRIDFRRGWMSAGRAFRLIQLMRLHEIDMPTSAPLHPDWIEVEEKRRTFWMAYSMDRFISIRNGWPLTLSEQVIRARLPAPEAEFQTGQPVSMGFLSEVITANDPVVLDAFTECIILATICGRALSHRHQSLVEKIYTNTSPEFWDRQQWINTTLTSRMKVLSQNYSPASQRLNPMLLFTSMMAHTTVLYLYKLMEGAIPATGQSGNVLKDYMRYSQVAAQEIVNLTNTLKQLSCFKVHPLTPVPLGLCAEFLMSYSEAGNVFNEQLQHVLEALQSLKSVNNLCQEFLQRFPRTKDAPDNAAA